MADKRFKYNPDEKKQEETKPRLGIGNCEAYGCNSIGHIKLSSWLCRYHSGKHPERWAHITMAMNNHDYAVKWYERVIAEPLVEFDLKTIHKHAPVGMEVNENETLPAYKQRMREKLQGILGTKF